MKINITAEKTLRNLQEEFQSYFPYLKIEFYRSNHTNETGTPKSEIIDFNLTVNDLKFNADFKEWQFSDSEKVIDFEKSFFHNSNIGIQVFRKTRNAYIQTIATDQWTLKEQNEEARLNLTEIEPEDKMDYHEQE